MLLCSQRVAEGACALCACLLPVAPGRDEGLCAARSASAHRKVNRATAAQRSVASAGQHQEAGSTRGSFF